MALVSFHFLLIKRFCLSDTVETVMLDWKRWAHSWFNLRFLAQFFFKFSYFDKNKFEINLMKTKRIKASTELLHMQVQDLVCSDVEFKPSWNVPHPPLTSIKRLRMLRFKCRYSFTLLITTFWFFSCLTACLPKG